MAFAERILPRASNLWLQASLDYKQRLQQLFFPEGIAVDGNRFNRTAATAPLFNYLGGRVKWLMKKIGDPNIRQLEPDLSMAEPFQCYPERRLILASGRIA